MPLVQHAPGEDQYGYEDAGERWMPVHSVESIVGTRFIRQALCGLFDFLQLISVISLLSSDKPNLDSPANVDAAKAVREDFEGAQAVTHSDSGTLTHDC
jgi:ubiquitin-conjugating enzyme E2 G1